MTSKWRTTFSLGLLAVVLGALAGYVDFNNDEVQMPALIVLVSSFALGMARPRLAWLWALIIGGGIPVGHAIGTSLNFQPAYTGLSAPYSGIILPLIFALAGAYGGALTRWRVIPLIRPRGR